MILRHGLLTVVISLSLVKQSFQDLQSMYVGAVVEYRPLTEVQNGQSVALENARNYIQFIKKAKTFKAEIIVFPENGLIHLKSRNLRDASYVPDPRNRIGLCEDSTDKYAEALKIISCEAIASSIYIVVNYPEKEDCPHCASDGVLLYNTNIVFDRDGKVIARYRKYNTYNEPWFNTTVAPEISTFTTDFNVTFGQFICFDILDDSPALTLVREHGIKDFIFTSRWINEVPFLSATEVQAGWAYANDANLLASGYNDPAVGSGGSGIYAGKKGIISSVQTVVPSNILIKAEIPKVVNSYRKEFINIDSVVVYGFPKEEIITSETFPVVPFNYKDDFSVYTTVPLNPNLPETKKTVCNRGLCCNFYIKTTFNNITSKQPGVSYYKYRLGAFNGVRYFGGEERSYTKGIEVCALIPCVNDTIQGCGSTFGPMATIIDPTAFESISIIRQKSNDAKNIIIPTAMGLDMAPISAHRFFYTFEGQNSMMIMPQAELNVMAFALYGRNFAMDGTHVTVGSVASLAFPSTLAIISFLVLERLFFLSLQ